MRNQLGNKAIGRFGARIADIAGRPTKMRRILVDILSCALVVGGAVAFPFGLALGTTTAPGLLLGAATSLGAGALALLLNRREQTGVATWIHVAAIALIAIMASFANLAPVSGLICLTLAGLHAALWRGLKPVPLPWLAIVVMSALSMSLVAWGPHPVFPTVGIAVTIFDIFAVMLIFSGQRDETVTDGMSLSNLLESVSDGLVRLTSEGVLIQASPATEEMFGCKAYSLSQAGLLERVHVLDRPAFLKAISDTCHDGTARQIELRLRRDPAPRQNGETQFIWSEIALGGAPAQGAAPTVYGLIREISARKAQEQRLEEARNDAEKASSSKSLFLATMGHELRTPLNAIVGFAEMMTSGIGGTLDDTHAEYASLIGQSGRHLLDVVNMLLDMSKINAGKFELHLEEFEPDSLVEPSLHMVSAMARSRRVHLRTDVAAALPVVKGDERAYRQIIINLLSNAIKFSNADGVVSLSIRRQGAKLSVTVSDQGIGMTSEQVARIGEPFFQAHAGLARQYEGTGLGLSIVKGLVELHDGVLRAKSSPDEGTTITVLLPLLGPESGAGSTVVTPIRSAAETAGQTLTEQPGKQSIAS